LEDLDYLPDRAAPRRPRLVHPPATANNSGIIFDVA
jgi:hypothetical protein